MQWFSWCSRGRSGLRAAFALGALLLVASTALHAQNNQIQVFIAATGADGAPLTDLKPEDIAMTENGMPGKIVTVERFNLPVRVDIVVDNGPESANVLAHFREGLSGFVAALPPDVEVALFTSAPQPRAIVRPTTNREEITRGIERFGPDSEAPRFTESIVEYVARLERDAKEKKLTYSPVLLLLSTPSREVSNAQIDTVERTLKTMLSRGVRTLALITATRASDQNQMDLVRDGRQAIIGGQAAKLSRGRIEGLSDWRRVVEILPEWGKEVAASHMRQTNQFRVVIERPAGASGPLNNVDLRITRPGSTGSVSGDGRFIPQ
jgi:hypothetical protein